MKEMDDVYNNVDLLLNKDPLIAKGMKVSLDAEFVIAVEDLRNYYKENRNVIEQLRKRICQGKNRLEYC